MKNNKGYYSWIHSLNSAAMESQKRGFEMLNEQKAKKIEGAKAQAMAKELSAQGKFAPPDRPQFQNAEAEDFQTDLDDYSEEDKTNIVQGVARELKTFEDPQGRPSVVDDPQHKALLAQIRSEKDSAPKDTNKNGVVTANDVAADAKDGKIDGTVGPGFTNPFAAQARIESGFPAKGDRDLVNARMLQDTVNALQMRAAGRHSELKPHHHELLAAHDAAAEEQAKDHEDREYGSRALDASLEDRPQTSYMKMESVSNKISRLLNLSE